MKKIFTVLAVLAVAACSMGGGEYRNSLASYGLQAPKEITNAEMANSRYAYVIARANGQNAWIHSSRSYLSMDGADDREAMEFPYYAGPDGADYDIFELEPGKYTLSSFIIGNGDAIFTTAEGMSDRNEALKGNSSAFASFTVSAGKTYYLGDLTIGRSKADMPGGAQGITIDTEYNTEAMLQYVRENYPNLVMPNKVIRKSKIIPGEYAKNTDAKPVSLAVFP